MNREKLVEQLIAIREQEKKIRKELDSIDYEERFNDAKQYEGRYFKEENKHNQNVRCLFVYATDKEGCTPMSLCVSYWKDNETSYFQIEHYSHFYPNKYDDDIDKWIEIDKDEYMQHHAEVQKRISMAVTATMKFN